MTPSNSAVPFWFAVEPMVRTKRLTCGGRCRFSSATCSAVGSVALLDAVENAVTIGRANARGRTLTGSCRRASARSDRVDAELLHGERVTHDRRTYQPSWQQHVVAEPRRER